MHATLADFDQKPPAKAEAVIRHRSAMKKSIGGNKAAEFLRKAAAALRGKAGVLRARLVFLASLRRRAAVVAGISRHIRALAPRGQEKAEAGGCAVVLSPDHMGVDDDDNERAATPDEKTRDDDGVVVGVAELASLFQEVDEGRDDGGRYQDWTLALRSLFDDDEEGTHGYGDRDDLDGDVTEGLDDGDDEPSVIDLIRSRREGEGRQFRLDDEIDQAADMYITRVRRRRMSAQTAELGLGVSAAASVISSSESH